MYSKKVRAGKRRTYFFDVRKTKGEDFYVTLTESTKKFNGDGYERHKIFLYKEDFNRFLGSLQDAINHVKENLMPEYDYDEYDRRQQEYEDSLEDDNYQSNRVHDFEAENNGSEAVEPQPKRNFEAGADDEMSW